MTFGSTGPVSTGDSGGDRLAQRLEEIPGVVAAAVGFGDQATPRRIWVAASGARPIEDVRADVVATLLDAGLTVPPEAISIGPIEQGGSAPFQEQPPPQEHGPPPDSGEMPPPWRGRFLLLRDLHVRLGDNHAVCQVRVARLGEHFDAEATDVDSEIGRARAAARATLLAAESAVPGVSLALEGLQIVPLFGRRYVALAVEGAAERRLTHLAGLVAIDASIENAACLSALRAVERWLAW